MKPGTLPALLATAIFGGPNNPPEPSAMVLAMAGGYLIGLLRRLRRR